MKYQINIPDFLREKLSGSKYNKAVEDILSYYDDWVARNDVVFFREYTDHGIDHIGKVLETSVLLMTESSKELFSDADSCLLIASAILHDVALHLQEDQFVALVEKDVYPNLNRELDKETWYELWVKFAVEASRFNQSQLQLLFNTKETIPIPDLNQTDKWTPLQYQLIGEFLRRHHPRLAHDFALYGFPSFDDKGNTVYVKPESEENSQIIDLAGLVARSHGLPLRSLFNYLTDQFGNIRVQEKAHAVYIMVLLRIADYLQLQSDRAPKGVMRVKKLKSPLSRQEWSIHGAINNIIYEQHEDPESVQIIIDHSKLDIEIYLRIENLLSAIQKELDSSWAVLGEVFGRFNEKEFGLIIRRLRSNIDNKEEFSKKTQFVLEKTTFTAADAELLKLFIKPLYGDRPAIAVRELVQNSVDAVRERQILEPKNQELLKAPCVLVSIGKSEDGRWILRVEDKGIGMTLHTIMCYYLNAGASYRLSMIWKEKFLNDRGKARVLRSGRFGVGALAAFMLADDPAAVEIKVRTRHLHSPVDGGFEFSTKLSDKPIEIKYVNKDEPGTIVEVYTSNPPSFMQESNKDNGEPWDWYCLNEPIVERTSLNGKRLPQAITLPFSKESSSHDYHWITTNDYDSIGWTYHKDTPSVICNGIVVNKDPNRTYLIDEGKLNGRTIKMVMPALSIFDKDGKLPITLDRLRIEYEQLQFIKELRIDIEKNILAFLLVSAPSSRSFEDQGFGLPNLSTHPALNESVGRIHWIVTKSGATLYCPELLHILQVKSIVEVSDNAYLRLIKSFVENREDVAIAVESYSIWSMLGSCSSVKGGSRLTIEGKVISERQLYKIEQLLNDSLIGKANNSSLEMDENYLDDYFRSKGINSNSTRDSLHKIYEHFMSISSRVQNKSKIYDYMDVLEKYFHNTDIRTIEQKTILYQLLNLSKFADIGKHINNISYRIDYPYVPLYRRNTEELLYRISRELDNLLHNNNNRHSDEINDQLNQIIRHNNPQDFDPATLKKVLNEIRNLNNEPPIIDIETFGTEEGFLPWDDLRKIDYGRRNHTPFTEFMIENDFRYPLQDNFLARIWLEYLGEEQIPLEEEKREKLIESISGKFDLSRHVMHWKTVLGSN